MKERMPILLALAAVFALLTGFHGGCSPGAHADPARIDRLVTAHIDDALDDLKATDAQRAQVHVLKSQLLQDGQKFAAGQREARKALVAQWDAAQPDAAQVHALIDARIDALRALAHETADSAIQLHGILTAEQRAQISKKIHRRME
jgi:protein CpxP